MNIEKVLIKNGYTKQIIKGTYYLIGNDIIRNSNNIFIHNLNHLCKCKEYLSKYKNALNKVIITNGITVYVKENFNIEVKENKIFTYIQ